MWGTRVVWTRTDYFVAKKLILDSRINAIIITLYIFFNLCYCNNLSLLSIFLYQLPLIIWLKPGFKREKNPVTILKRTTKTVNSIFLIENSVLVRFLKIIGMQNQLPIGFGTALVCNKISLVRNYPLKHKNFKLNILLRIKPE